MIVDVLPGIVIPLKPFFGSMGVAPPPASGRISSNPPWTARRQPRQQGARRRHDALHSGPRHRRAVRDRRRTRGAGRRRSRSDGDRDLTRGRRVQLTVRKGMTLAWPRGETPTHYISMGTDEDLTVATRVAIQEMVEFLVATKHYDRHTAYQPSAWPPTSPSPSLVDGRVGVHVKMPKSIFKR